MLLSELYPILPAKSSNPEISCLSVDPEVFCLTEVPVWENHSRGKNWMAAITRDPSAPSGLDRKFFPMAKGEGVYYRLDQEIAPVPFPVEFGADYYSGSGRKNASRKYGVVVRIARSEFLWVETVTAIQACKLAKELAAIPLPMPSPTIMDPAAVARELPLWALVGEILQRIPQFLTEDQVFQLEKIAQEEE